MNPRDRMFVAAQVVAGAAAVLGVFVAASQLCPAPTLIDPCPEADRNRLVVVGLAGAAVVLLITPAAFVIDYLARRRIAYLGAWWRAARRGALFGLVLATLAGLRLADALNPFSAVVVIGMALIAEWLAIRRLDTE